MAKKPRLSPEHKEARDLGLEKLALSDIDADDVETLSLAFLSATETAKLGFDARPAIRINYLDPIGRPMQDWPKAKPFYRIRYLGEVQGFGKGEKPKRYEQPSNTVCCVYFPQNQEDWPKVLKDVETPLIFTEGEFKAAAACKYGFPTLGVGGVYNWRSLGKGLTVLPELKTISWIGRHVYLAFDSDYLTNPMVLAALKELGDWLVDEGAFVYVVTLPVLEKEVKTGLDDLLVAEGAEAFHKALKVAAPLGLTQALFDFNKSYVYIRNPGLVLGQKDQSKVNPSAFREHLEATKTTYARELKPDGSVSNRPVSAAAAWLGWPLRYQANKLTYAPGREQFMLPEAEWNAWSGWGCEAKKGDIKPFMRLVDHIFTGAEPDFKKWFLQWLAYPLQNPGTKLFSAMVIHGIEHGTGKSLLGLTMKRIYGSNFVEIKNGHLQGGFNAWAENKQFVLGDEISSANKRGEADAFKALITQDSIEINAKYVPTYFLPDCINYLFTSNHPDPLFIEDRDRRFGIHEVIVGAMEHSFYTGYAGIQGKKNGWLDKKGPDGTTGAEHIFHYLMNLDLKGFHPNAPAFKSAARDRMIADIQSEMGSWVREVMAPGATHFPSVAGDPLPIGRDLYTAGDLLTIYDPLDKKKVTATGLGKEFKRAGAFQVCNGAPLRLKDGAQVRLYCLRNGDTWRKAKPADCVKYVEGAGAAKSRAKKEKNF